MSDCAERGREEPDSDAGSHAADPSVAARSVGAADARLRAPWNHGTVRCPRHSSQCSRTDQSDPRLHPDLQQRSAALSMGRKREPGHSKGQSLSTNVRNGELEIEKRLQSIIAALLLKTSAFGVSILDSDAHVGTCSVERIARVEIVKAAHQHHAGD